MKAEQITRKMSASIQILLTICVMSLCFVDCARILVLFYHPGPSHFHSYYPLFNELAERGHNVTVLSYNEVKDAHENYNQLILSEMPILNASITYDTMVSGKCVQFYFIIYKRSTSILAAIRS